MWINKILQIRPELAKFLAMYYMKKIQHLQGTTSYKGTTNLEGKVDNKLGGWPILLFSWIVEW